MKYAREIIDLMGAYPGRQFRMSEIMRHICHGRDPCGARAEAIRRGARRVLDQLMEDGHVSKSGGNTRSASYCWGVLGHAVDRKRPILGQIAGQ